MKVTSNQFPANVRRALTDEGLQAALGRLRDGFVVGRAAAVARLPEFDALRDQARDIRDHTLDHLDIYLERFEAQVIAQGGHVHWCRDGAAARTKVLEICRALGARTVTKGKSMVGEEIAINQHLEANGIEPIETDLGEYIIQLRREAPSHIIAPATHVSKEQVTAAFRAEHDALSADRPLDAPEELMAEARAELRDKFLAADVGITGANFMIAETGTSVIVTNEGNGDLTQILPKAHIVLGGIEKVVPTLEDATTLLRVLARSATGQDMSSYTTFSTGPKRDDDPDGPDEYHVILIDNGRADLLAGDARDILRCIRCGACMNHCPVYGAVGGHAYGSVYPGPMGAVLTPGLTDISEAAHLPQASTLCGKCEEVCPVRIPLPKLLRSWRFLAHQTKETSLIMRAGIRYWAFFATRPRLYQWASSLKFRLLGWTGRRRGYYRNLPTFGSWTRTRDFPAPEGDTFMAQWKAGRRPGNHS